MEKMFNYETIIIAVPTMNKEQEKEIENKYMELIKQNGTLTKVENLGKKKLAYEVKKHKEGIYFVFKFESNPEFISELERQYRIDDNVIKFITVRED